MQTFAKVLKRSLQFSDVHSAYLKFSQDISGYLGICQSLSRSPRPPRISQTLTGPLSFSEVSGLLAGGLGPRKVL